MLDKLLDLVKQFGQDTVVKNPAIPNEYNNKVLADATKTIGSGFQNIMAGGGFQNILDLFKKGGSGSGGGIGGLLKNPIVTMMVGYFISKLVGKYKMSPAAASNVSNQLIPEVLGGLINRTSSKAPEDDAFDLNDLIGSLTGGKVQTSESGGGFNFQDLLSKLTGGGKNDGENGEDNLEDVIGQVTRGAQENQGEQSSAGGGLMDLIKGFLK